MEELAGAVLCAVVDIDESELRNRTLLMNRTFRYRSRIRNFVIGSRTKFGALAEQDALREAESEGVEVEREG